ncbi:uncharacterized protein LOC132804028 [Ziziphus jujuba]|uniref:Uncharacterized protein LOC132804028 n=1 Tax=Ziziphus jujuba TaxID=326968 RepID=A0ABM4AB05_ZIZJJ|nr:uncharacterized protein LOC132804028 [Ziziphus jujuba]
MASGDKRTVPTQTFGIQMPPSASHAEKLEKFNGANFKSNEESDRETLMAVDAWNNSNYLRQNYVLNGLSDALYGVYCGTKSAKELWETLDKKYKTKNVDLGKFITGRFLDYMMVDTEPLMNQAFIGKLRIEDDNRKFDKRASKAGLKANVVEHGQSSKNKKNIGKASKLGPKGGISKKAKFQGRCFNYDKMGHRAMECRLPKRKRNQAQVMEDITREIYEIDLNAVISEVNLVGSNPREWWVNTSATRHVCSEELVHFLRTKKEWG